LLSAAAIVCTLALPVAWARGGSPALPLPTTRPNLLGRALDATPGHKAGGYDLSAHQTLSRVILLIRENYVEPDRVKPADMFMAALDYIQRSVAEVMVDDSAAPSRIVVSVGGVAQAFDVGGLDQLWEVTMALRDIFRFLQAHVAGETAQRNIEYAAVNGMLSTLDPHSVLLKPESSDEMRMSTRGEFGGLGIVISLRDGALTIISPIEGTPASAVGLKSRDKIVKIGEESTVNMGLDEAVQRLRGEPDSRVDISVQRKGWSEPRAFALTRAIIKIESVSGKLLDGGVGYVKVKSFQGNTFDDLQAHLERLKKEHQGQPLKGLVLDLRNNPGGLLDQAILVSDRFIEKGPLVITVGEGNRRREVRNAKKDADDMTYPMVVLLNGGSASASEIVSGALKNHDRAVVIGQQSFGKGSVQVLYDFKEDRSALKLTVAQYLTPGDLSIQSLGVVPDVLVEPAVIEPAGIRVFVDDESPREKDLAKHLEQHGVSKLVTSSHKLYHLVREEALDGNDAAAGKGRDVEAEMDATLAQATGAFEYDFEVALAHDVLRQTRALSRPQMLTDAQALLAQRAKQEDGRIAQRMGELGVDWREGPNVGEANVAIRLSSSAQANAIVAGETLRLTGEVENRGEAPLYRVWAASQSDNPLLKNLEFAFGYLPPGGKKRWSVDVKLPKDLVARADEVALAPGGAHAGTGAGRAFVTIVEQPKPEFSFTSLLEDAAGNQDGCLQAGEAVTLMVDVANVGTGVAEEAVVIVKNLSGQSIFLDSGRAHLGRLAPGEHKKARLTFQVYGKSSAQRAEAQAREEGDDRSFAAPAAADQLSLKLMVWDGALGASLVEKLQYRVAPPASPVPQADCAVVKASEVPVFAGACDGAARIGTLKRGAKVAADASFGSFLRVDLPGGRAFVKSDDVVRAKAGKKVPAPSAAQYQALEGVAAPRIWLEPSTLIVDKEEFHLRGTVEDPRALKDMFVFVDDKKVFFRYLSDIAQHDGRFRYAFDVPVKLKAGTNAVALFVRENEELASRRLFFVHRTDTAVVAAPAGAASP
jgi:carboxyl-terminal processing protease